MTATTGNWAARPTHESPTSLISAWFGAARRAWIQHREHRRAHAHYRALGAVSDATLRDIGVRRCEIMSMSLGDASGRRRSFGCR